MEHDGHRERLRARYEQEGLSGFAPHEVLELLLTYAIPRVNTNPQAHRLIERFGSLHGVLEASQTELEQVEGIGPRASTLITMMVPLLRAYEQEKLLPRRKLATFADLAAFCHTLYLGVNNEQFYVLCFDAKLQLLATSLIASGSPAEVNVMPRLVVQELMRHNAVGAVISHNHPSGSPLPSAEDLAMTREISSILESVGIRLYDHVLIAGSREYSFFAHGLLNGTPSVTPFPEETAQAADRPQRTLPARNHKK